MNNFWWFWILALLLKLAVGATLPFSSDEAYYWVWSNHLSLGYFDHPAMIAWLAKLGQPLDSFGLRWPAILVGHSSWILWYKLFEKELTKTKLLVWNLLVLFNPLIGWGSFLLIPDTPALFFWSLSIFCALRWSDERNYFWALALGAALGLGFNSKYQIVLFVPSLLVWMTWTRQWRKLPWGQVFATVASGLIFCAPVLIWNYQHNFDSFLFQIGHGLKSEEINRLWPLEYLGSQIALLFPTVFALSLTRPTERRQRFLYVLGWLTIVFFLWTSFSARPEGNWPILAYAPLITLAVLRAKKILSLQWTAAVWILAFGVAMSEAYWQWLPIQNKSDIKTYESIRFDEFIPKLEADFPIYASSFQMAATLNFKTRKPVYKLKTLSRRDFYDYIPESEPPSQGKFGVLANRETDFSQTILKNHKLLYEDHFTPQKKLMVYEVSEAK